MWLSGDITLIFFALFLNILYGEYCVDLLCLIKNRFFFPLIVFINWLFVRGPEEIEGVCVLCVVKEGNRRRGG